jgi:hypothetical protein
MTTALKALTHGGLMPAPHADLTPCLKGERSTCIRSEDNSAIMFLPCGFVSFNPNDARERYCALCHRFMETEIDDQELSSKASHARSG